MPYAYSEHIYKPNAVVVLRKPEALLFAREKFPEARLYLWLHDLVDEDYAVEILCACKQTNAFIITVSDFHKDHVAQAIQHKSTPLRIYNPVDDGLIPDETPVNKNKLVFFSSPHKGLVDTLQYHQAMRTLISTDIELYVSNPGYLDTNKPSIDGVHWLGALPHHEAIKHVREALCVFYINQVFPETFGLVLAEANAVGTPVLTPNIGAASEILYHPAEILTGLDKIEPTLRSWYDGNRPIVRGKSEYRLSNVIKSWIKQVVK